MWALCVEQHRPRMESKLEDLAQISKFFDRNHYLSQLGHDLDGVTAEAHYFDFGWKLGLDPNRTFSTAFYLMRSPDVRREQINPFLHYIKWGKYEGRAASPNDTRPSYTLDEKYVAEYFDASYYILKYPHVAENNCDPLKHYMNFGWLQGYDPCSWFQTSYYINENKEVDFNLIKPFVHRIRAIRRACHDANNSRNIGLRNRTLSRIDHLSDAPAISVHQDPPWKKYLVVPEFLAMNPQYSSLVHSYSDALIIFEQVGIEHGAFLSFDAVFDYEFYASYYPDTRALSPSNSYRHWLFEGSGEGRACSEAMLYEKLTGRRHFPNAFDWSAYRSSLPLKFRHDAVRRWHCYEHFLDTVDAADAPRYIVGEDAAELYEILADRAWSRKQPDLAIAYMKLAISSSRESASLYHKIADYYRESNNSTDALYNYNVSIKYDSSSVWTYINAASLYQAENNFISAYNAFKASKNRYEGNHIWRGALDQLIRADFDRASLQSRKLFADNADEDAEELLDNMLARVKNAMVELEGLPAAVGPNPEGHIVFFALTSVPQCKHYRVDQRIQQLDFLKLKYKFFSGSQPIEAREALIGSRALLIYREPAFTDNIRLILHANALGVPTYYDIDDLIFDPQYYPDSYSTYEDQISYEEYIGLKYASSLYKFAISLCDYGVTSTASLARHIAPLTKRNECFLVQNALDDRNESFLLSKPRRTDKDEIYIFYGSGAKAHNRNFNECIAPALARVMSENPFVHVVIAGYLTINGELSAFGDRIHKIDFITDIQTYWALLEQMDISVATLVPGEMNDCKSEIKWIEASCCSVASVLSASATYRSVVTDGHDAMLVFNEAQWYEKLSYLVNNKLEIVRLSTAAKDSVIDKYSLPRQADYVRQMLDRGIPLSIEGGAHPLGSGNRRRVLVVNVLFSPQTYGGATRIVEQEVSGIARYYGKSFDVAVFTADHLGPSNHSRIDSFDGVPVFRFAPAEHSPAIYENQQAALYFEEVIEAWRPDVIHFHSLQYISASLAEVALKKEVPYVVTIHDGWWFSRNQFLVDEYGFDVFSQVLSFDRKSVEDLRRSHMLRLYLHRASAITTVSKSFAEICKIEGFQDIIVTENWVPSLPGGASSHIRERSGKIKVLFVGGCAIHKGFHLFKAAFLRRRFDNLTPVFVDHERSSGYKSRDKWGENDVEILGYVPPVKMGELYANVDILCAPSIWPESFGLVSREASRSGLWVIANSRGSMGSEVEHGVDGFVIDTADYNALFECLSQIEQDPAIVQVRPRLHKQGQSENTQVADFIEIFNQVIET